ncbi:Slc25a29, partial [Symbiodinium microadriaticum]
PSDPDRRRRATVDESESRRRTDPSDPNRRRDPSDPNRRRTDAWDPNRRRDPADANRRRSSTNLLLNEGTAQQAWDKAVAFYAGSRWDSRADAVMLDAEANMLCSLFGTCDEEDEGVSMASDKIFRHFESGQTALMQDECGNLTTDRDRIVALMYVPLIQNLLYASYKLATKMSNEEPLIQRDRGHGIFFAKAMQPKLASCAQDVADIVARNLLVPSPAREMPVACLTFQQHVCLLYRRFQCVKVPKSEEPMQDGYAEAFSLRNAVGNDLLGESCEHLVLFKEVAPKQQVKLALERTYDCLGEDIGGILEDPLSQANVKYAPGAEPCGFVVFDASAPQPQAGVDAGVVVAVVLSVLAFAAVVVLLAWRVAYSRGAERARFIMRTPEASPTTTSPPGGETVIGSVIGTRTEEVPVADDETTLKI